MNLIQIVDLKPYVLSELNEPDQFQNMIALLIDIPKHHNCTKIMLSTT